MDASPTTQRQAQKARTREALCAAALACFAEKGVAATQIADITARAGVAKGTFYVHFTDKEALLDTLLEGFVERLAAALAPTLAMAARCPLEQTARCAAGTALAFFREEQVFVRAYVERTSLGLDPSALAFGLNPPAQRLLHAALAARAHGALDVEAELVVHGLLGLWLRLLMRTLHTGPEEDAAIERALVVMSVGALEGVLGRSR